MDLQICKYGQASTDCLLSQDPYTQCQKALFSLNRTISNHKYIVLKPNIVQEEKVAKAAKVWDTVLRG